MRCRYLVGMWKCWVMGDHWYMSEMFGSALNVIAMRHPIICMWRFSTAFSTAGLLMSDCRRKRSGSSFKLMLRPYGTVQIIVIYHFFSDQQHRSCWLHTWQLLCCQLEDAQRERERLRRESKLPFPTKVCSTRQHTVLHTLHTHLHRSLLSAVLGLQICILFIY